MAGSPSPSGQGDPRRPQSRPHPLKRHNGVPTTVLWAVRGKRQPPPARDSAGQGQTGKEKERKEQNKVEGEVERGWGIQLEATAAQKKGTEPRPYLPRPRSPHACTLTSPGGRPGGGVGVHWQSPEQKGHHDQAGSLLLAKHIYLHRCQGQALPSSGGRRGWGRGRGCAHPGGQPNVYPTP